MYKNINLRDWSYIKLIRFCYRNHVLLSICIWLFFYFSDIKQNHGTRPLCCFQSKQCYQVYLKRPGTEYTPRCELLSDIQGFQNIHWIYTQMWTSLRHSRVSEHPASTGYHSSNRACWMDVSITDQKSEHFWSNRDFRNFKCTKLLQTVWILYTVHSNKWVSHSH